MSVCLGEIIDLQDFPIIGVAERRTSPRVNREADRASRRMRHRPARERPHQAAPAGRRRKS